MKHISILFLLLLSLTACEDDDDPQPTGLLGTWELVEVYADPGDGSGDFVTVASERILNFVTDSTYTSNAIVCEFSVNTNQLTVISEGTYDLPDGKLYPEDCRNLPAERVEIDLELRGNDLILSYPCIEACQHKYRRR